MSYKYVEEIKCFSCGGKNLAREYILNGLTRCTCNICGTKFLAQCDGSDIVDRYVADRSRVTAVMETASLGEGALNEARDGLKTLVNSYSAIVDIDPVYHWYKIILLTDNFKSFGQYEEAEKEYKKVSESYVVDATDKTRTDGYEKLYGDYYKKYQSQRFINDKKKRKKKKLIWSLSVSGVFAVLIAAFLGVFCYNPVLKDGNTGVKIKLNNSAYGLFDKFSVSMEVESIGKDTLKYDVVSAAIENLTVKYEVYEINLYKNGSAAKPGAKVSVTVPLPEGYNKSCIAVYSIDGSGLYEEITDVSVSSGSVEFSTDKTYLFAVAERMLKVTFDSGDGETEVKNVRWGDSVAEPVPVAEKFGYIFDGWYCGDKKYNFSQAVAQDTVLTARWVRDSKYEGYTYISTAAEFCNIASNVSGKYLLINDIDMGGADWSVIKTFRGTLDGGCHSVYNFNVKSATDYADLDSAAGIFGKLDKGATVCNLQVGREGAATEYSFSPWQRNVFMGAIAGYCSGEITNCRVVNCTMYAHTAAQEEKFRNSEFASNVGGIAGVVREGVITRCYVTGSNFNSDSWSRYNNISNTARCGGIVGYADNSTVADCLIENNIIYSKSQTADSALANKVGQPYAEAGGVIGHAVNTVIERIVAEGNNSVSADKLVGNYNNGVGHAYSGCMFGVTDSTKPKNLIGVNTSLKCSGSNDNYPEFTKITQNSLELLIKTDTAFGNGYWVESGGKISLLFNV